MESASRAAPLDGFPRTVAQACSPDDVLQEMGLKLDHVIHIEVEEEELIAPDGAPGVPRLRCQYHIKFNCPRCNVCDQCGGELYQREDDSLATVTERLAAQNRQSH